MEDDAQGPHCLQALAANAAALAAAAAGQNGFGGLNSGGMLNSMEYQAAYQVHCSAVYEGSRVRTAPPCTLR